MKISWGVKIVIVYSLFVLFLAIVIWYSFSVDVNLVTDDYYQQELVYQDHIDKVERTNKLEKSVAVKVASDIVVVKFPSVFDPQSISGELLFYRPSDQNKDLKIEIDLNSAGEQYLPKSDLQKGYWKIKINWFADSLEYYNEKIIVIN